MGTNYYHRYNICSECRRYDKRHIGKSSAGWQFSFKGWKDSEGRPAIKSWQDWKYILKTFKDGQIFDEYGKEWSYASYLQDSWKDAEGWDFTWEGFS